MIKIYHNPRCSKSRCGLELLDNSGKDFEIVKYLDTPPNNEEVLQLLTLLKIAPIDLVRKNEAIWKENYKGKEMTEAQIVQAMVEFPKLIERPIVIKGNKAVIGRPIEKVVDLLKE